MGAKTLSSEIKTAGKSFTALAIVPESQLWTLKEPHRYAIAKGMAWAAKTDPAETNLDSLEVPQTTSVFR